MTNDANSPDINDGELPAPARPGIARDYVHVVHERNGARVELSIDLADAESASFLTVLQLLSDAATDACNRLVEPDDRT